MEIKNIKEEDSRVSKKIPKAIFKANKKPWEIVCDIALPCATK